MEERLQEHLAKIEQLIQEDLATRAKKDAEFAAELEKKNTEAARTASQHLGKIAEHVKPGLDLGKQIVSAVLAALVVLGTGLFTKSCIDTTTKEAIRQAAVEDLRRDLAKEKDPDVQAQLELELTRLTTGTPSPRGLLLENLVSPDGGIGRRPGGGRVVSFKGTWVKQLDGGETLVFDPFGAAASPASLGRD